MLPFCVLALAVIPYSNSSSSIARDFSRALSKQVQENWQTFKGKELSNSPFRDKNRFALQFTELRKKEKPNEKEIRSALREFEKFYVQEKGNAHFEWRAMDLFGAMYAELKQNQEAVDHYQKALKFYPDEQYKQLQKHSSFHHIANEAAGLLWDWKGVDAAEEFLLEEFRQNPKFHYVYALWWQERFEQAELEERFSKFLLKLAEIYRAKAESDWFVKDSLDSLLKELKGMEPLKPFLVGENPKKKYFLLRPESLKESDEKHLVLILPGGHGKAKEFLPWINQLYRESGTGMVFAVLSAPEWSSDQDRVIWVTRFWMNKYKEAQFPVEQFISEVVEDVKSKKLFTAKKVLLLGWSSSGPALYSTALAEEKVPYDGYYIQSSVFKPEQLDLKLAKGKKFYLQQGTEDKITELSHAKRAEKELKKNGAVVTLDVFRGGHGFAMENQFESVRKGLDWLLEEGKGSE